MVYPIGKYLIPLVYYLWLRKVEGRENIPRDTPFIIAANHSSFYDTLLPYTIMSRTLNKQVHALVNSRYWGSFFHRRAFEWGKCIPVYVEKDVRSKKKNKQALEKAVSFLKKGHLIQIFPEGTRSYDGQLKKAHTGVAYLALKAKVPILPFAIIGSEKVMPKGTAFPRFARAEIRIGKPICFEKYYGKKINKKIMSDISRQVMEELARLSGKKYNY